MQTCIKNIYKPFYILSSDSHFRWHSTEHMVCTEIRIYLTNKSSSLTWLTFGKMADGILAIIKGRHGTCSDFCFCVFAPLLKIFEIKEPNQFHSIFVLRHFCRLELWLRANKTRLHWMINKSKTDLRSSLAAG